MGRSPSSARPEERAEERFEADRELDVQINGSDVNLDLGQPRKQAWLRGVRELWA